MGRLDEKITLITGGARGQGAAEATRFVAEGATVYLTDVRADEGAALASGLGAAATFLHHDVTREDDWRGVVGGIVEEHGRIDVLVNNAAIYETGGLFDFSLDDWNRIVAINQTGVFLGLQFVGAVMRERGAGSIVNISSIAGLRGTRSALPYAATKWAVRGMTKSAALELAPDNVRVNSVHPGIIETPMLDEAGANLSRLREVIPLGRTAPPDEVANLVLFLASDESAYCSGHEFVVDGAMSA